MANSTSNAAHANSIEGSPAAQQSSEAHRPRGPHPLPLFWQMARHAIGDDRARMRRLMVAVARYQAAAPVAAMPPPRTVARDGNARLLSYGGEGPPVILVPSLVNSPAILDLAPGRTLVRWLADEGFAAYLVAWGTPDARSRGFDLGDHVERLDRLIADLPDATLVGYCLGGTLAMASAATGRPRRALATIATPWDFAGYPAGRRAEIAKWWRRTERLAAPLGEVPMDLIQPAFWALDPAAPVAKFERYADMGEDDPAARRFEAVEDWANSGAPVPLPAMREAMAGLFEANRTGTGIWRVAGQAVTPAAIDMPWLNLVSATDRIVPAAAAPPAKDTRPVAAGHVGMIIGGKAKTAVWEPLARWLRSL
ncbi:MAG: alpha/beta hydrolase [Pseudomonadota bacterium]